MAEVAARATFVLDVDGKRVPVEVRKIADQAGREGDRAGKEFGDNFDRRLTPKMRETADRLGKHLSDGLTLKGDVLRRNENLIRAFGQNGSSHIDRLADRMTAFAVKSEDAIRRVVKNPELAAWGALESARLRAQRFGDSVGRSFDLVRGRASKLWDSLDEGNGHLHGLNLQWKDLSHNTRQWTLIIGAILAGIQDLGVLSSAAGAGIFALGGAISALALGGGALVAMFSVLGKEIEELPQSMRQVAIQFRGFRTSLTETRDIIASAAFREMPNTFNRLAGTVRALSPEFSRLGTAAGRVFDDFSAGVDEGSAGFAELRTLIRNASNDFPALANAAGTWTVGLLRGINRANPLVQQLIGYVQELGTRFDNFTQTDAFGEWVRNSQTTFSALGELLDATGRALNDLVTPESLTRTQAFLGNLTEFMPNLSKLLDIIGRLDVFGLAAQLLNDFGEALEPLAKPMGELADGLNDVASILIEQLAHAIGIVAKIVAPLAQGLANVIDAMPPQALQVAAGGVVALAGAFVLLKGAQGLAGAAAAIGLFSGASTKAASAAGKLSGVLQTLGGKAGLFGLIAVGASVGFEALDEFGRSLTGIDKASNDAIASGNTFANAYEKIADTMYDTTFRWKGVLKDSIDDFDNVDAALTRLGDNDAALLLAGPFETAASEAMDLRAVLNEMDEPLARLAENDMSAAIGQFSAYARELGASDAQVEILLDRLPQFSGALKGSADQMEGLASSSDLVDIAMGRAKIGSDNMATGLDLMTVAADGATAGFDGTTEALQNLEDQVYGTRNKARDFEEQLDNLADTVVNNLAAGLDISTEAGRANESAIDDMAQSSLEYASQIRKTTGDQDAANAVIQKGRDALIEQLAQLGITGTAAEDYADKLGLIPDDVKTDVQTPGLIASQQGAEVLDRQLRGLPPTTNSNVNVWTNGVGEAERSLNWVARERTANIRVRQVGDVLPKTAIGGTFSGAQARVIAEAGPEAVVPLNRPLSQVHPSVRWLSAIAQGRRPAPGASDGGTGKGKMVNFNEGAIVVQAAEDPRRTAFEVADVVAERAAS